MNPREVSAQFAAYAWYQGCKTGRPATEGEAVRFARENWRAFRGCAPEGLSRPLIRIACGRQGGRRRLAPAGAAGREGSTMYHLIELAADLWVDVERSPRHCLERVRLRGGTCVLAQLRPQVVEAPEGPVEAADLYFADGTAARAVPYATFRFPD
jgi:hypothetical protein